MIHSGLDGFGDTIQMIRYAPLVKARGGMVVLVCHSSLVSLLATCEGIDRVAAEGVRVQGELAWHNVQAALMSLPAILGTTMETVPARVPYLSASAESLAKWKPIVEGIGGYRVGITWQGRPDHENDVFRSVKLTEFAPLASVPGVSLVPLQKGPAREQIASCRFPLVDLGEDYHTGNWLDTAAVVSHLDLVISPDTAIAHLAGALGRPTWIALPRPAEWRWMRDREDSPWYPTARLFRQTEVGAWGPVFARMAAELRVRVTASP
jgi:hypothetical protein